MIDFDAKLSRLGLEQGTARTNQIADVPALEGLIDAFGQSVALQEQLDATRRIQQMRETRLTHNALAHHTPGHAHSDLISLQPFTIQVAIARMQLGSER